MSEVELAAGWQALAEQASYTHYRPLSEAAHRLIADTQTNRRVFTGIDQLDAEMRGISAGHLAFIVGYSHSGKTLVALHMIAANRAKRVLYMVPDEPAPLVLTKLTCMAHGVSGDELEERLRLDDPWGRQVLNDTIEQFSNLVVFDRPLTPRSMNGAYQEACDVWGEPADLVVVDYLDLVQAGEAVQGKADFVKAFGSEHQVPMIVLHQTSRSAGSRGQAMRIDSGNFGGETWATYQIGVWRRKAQILAELQDLYFKEHKTEYTLDRIDQLERDLAVHQYTLTLNLNKNKRPSGRLIDAIDFEMDQETGVLTPLHGALPTQYLRRSTLRSVQ